MPRASRPDPAPPIADRRPVTLEHLGERRVDPYAWLRNREDPAVLEHLQAENTYTDAATAHLAPLRERLYAEMLGRIQETDVSVPDRIDDWLYYVRTEAGRQYPILCRRHAPDGAEPGPEEILLDENGLAEGHAYFHVGATRVSPDHRRLAYAVDTSGNERYVLQVKDLATGALLPERIPDTAHGVEWSADGAALYYIVLNEAHRPATVRRHVLGTAVADDVTVFHEPDEAFYLDLAKSRSRAYIVLHLASHSTSEARCLPADEPGEFRVVLPRVRGVEYEVAHHGDRFYVLTNENALDFRLVSVPIDAPDDRGRWEEVLPHRPGVKLDGIDLFRDFLVVYERSGGLQRIGVLPLAGGERHDVEFPEPVYSLRRSNNPMFDSTSLRYVYASPVTPPTVIDYDMGTRARTVRKVTPVLGGYDPARYLVERVTAAAPDGARVPISLVYRTPLERDGRRPMLLRGYGAYGMSYDPGFSSNVISLLDRGVVVGIAHVRGGEEMGRQWYEDGRLLNKPNTFADFIAAAEHLIADGVTAPDRLAIMGGSAGGLLIGAVLNARPDLFRAAVADVPFVDVVNTMLDPSLPLTVIEYDEWGDPNRPEFFSRIRSYSPYDNVRPQRYPAILATAGLNDPRVAYWEPAKWVARLRAEAGAERVLLRTNLGAGHGGASGRYDFLREVAFEYAFVLDELGAADPD